MMMFNQRPRHLFKARSVVIFPTVIDSAFIFDIELSLCASSVSVFQHQYSSSTCINTVDNIIQHHHHLYNYSPKSDFMFSSLHHDRRQCQYSTHMHAPDLPGDDFHRRYSKRRPAFMYLSPTCFFTLSTTTTPPPPQNALAINFSAPHNQAYQVVVSNDIDIENILRQVNHIGKVLEELSLFFDPKQRLGQDSTRGEVG